jgi:2',3'-cyclic-nucleotide 2'-phosphodiesterase (5'-nucleotidase family)
MRTYQGGIPILNGRHFRIVFVAFIILMINIFPVFAIQTPEPLNSTAPVTGEGKEADLKILYSASLKGNLDGCSCKKIPKAGLVKRAYFIRSLAKRDNVMLVDAGDLLEYRNEDIFLADYILEAYRDLKYDAIGVGDNEFSNGIGKLLEYGKKYPFIATNLSVYTDNGKLVTFSKTLKILNKGNYRVGVFSLLETGQELLAFYPEQLQQKIKLAPQTETAVNTVKAFEQKNVDLIVLLYHGIYDNAVLLAKNVPGIDVIVAAHEGRLVDAQMAGDTIVVSSGDEGNRLGILELSISKGTITQHSNSFRLFNYDNDPDDPTVRTQINKYYDELTERIKKEKAKNKK